MEKFLTSWHIRRDTTIKLKDGIHVLQKSFYILKSYLRQRRKNNKRLTFIGRKKPSNHLKS